MEHGETAKQGHNAMAILGFFVLNVQRLIKEHYRALSALLDLPASIVGLFVCHPSWVSSKSERVHCEQKAHLFRAIWFPWHR
jgi:hypothetical protein